MSLALRIEETTGTLCPGALLPCERAHREGHQDYRRRVSALSRAGQLLGHTPERHARIHSQRQRRTGTLEARDYSVGALTLDVSRLRVFSGTL
jgi:hypothetical protein